jgi:hypothetical protein
MNVLTIGRWFVEHYQKRKRVSGTFKTAVQLRKQGVPLHIATLILIDREVRSPTKACFDSFRELEEDLAYAEDHS